MNYNPHTPFSEQDYHLLKTHQSSGGGGGGGGGSAIKQELLKSVLDISFDNQHNYMFDIACDNYLDGDFSFNGSTGCIITKIGPDDPTTVDASRMIITVVTNADSGTRGQIEWGGVKWNIICTSGANWTITLPSGRFYNGIKTEVGDPGEVL